MCVEEEGQAESGLQGNENAVTCIIVCVMDDIWKVQKAWETKGANAGREGETRRL